MILNAYLFFNVFKNFLFSYIMFIPNINMSYMYSARVYTFRDSCDFSYTYQLKNVHVFSKNV